MVIKMSIVRYELTDEQWERVKGLIYHSKMGRPPKDNRVMLNAMLWMARSGARWEDLP
jgi:transposase